MHLSTRVLIILTVILTVAPVVTVAAQQPLPLHPGDRIRAMVPSLSSGPLVGTVVAFQTDSLIVQGGTSTWHLSLASLTHLDVSQGRRSHALLGAGIGLLVGAAVGVLIASDCDTVEGPFATQGQCTAVGAAVFGGAGALVGALTGALARTEQWAQVPLARLRMSLTPNPGGALQLRASLSF